jgi:hypothetical protein
LLLVPFQQCGNFHLLSGELCASRALRCLSGNLRRERLLLADIWQDFRAFRSLDAH